MRLSGSERMTNRFELSLDHEAVLPSVPPRLSLSFSYNYKHPEHLISLSALLCTFISPTFSVKLD